MLSRSIKIGALAAFGIVLSLGVVSAQSAEPSDGESAATLSPRDTSRTPEQMLAEATVTQGRMEAGSDSIARMLRQARQEKDVVKVLCLDDKLSQMNVATRSAADRLAGLQAAIDSNNAERASHEDAVLSALASRGDDLMAEANQCIGEESAALGDTQLEIRVDDDIPLEDTASRGSAGVNSAAPVANTDPAEIDKGPPGPVSPTL